MQPRLSAFVLASLLVVVAVTPLPAAVDANLLTLIMPEAKTVAGIDVVNARKSPFGQYVLQNMQKEDEGFARFVEQTGFDPRRDLDEVLMASDGPGHERGIVLAKGTFNVSRIVDHARSAGATVTTENGVPVITGRNKANGRQGSIAFIAGNIAIAGSSEAVREALNRRGGRPPLDPALTSRISELSSTGHAWFVTTDVQGAWAARLQRRGNQAAQTGQGAPRGRAGAARMVRPEALQGIRQMSGKVEFGDVVRVSAEALARSDKDATALADVLRFLAGMAQLNRENPQAAKLATLLDSLEIATKGDLLTLSFAVPEEQLEQILKPNRRSALGRREVLNLD